MIRVFVGAGPAQRVPFAVLASSIAARASQPVSVKSLGDLGVTHARPRDPANRPRTPFSFQRFAIPKLCDYSGRAIYLDSDMVVLDDIARLWRMDMGMAAVLATDVTPAARNAVLLIDCERTRWSLPDIVRRLDSGKITYRGLMEDLEDCGRIDRSIPVRWNRLDDYVEGYTSILHFTDMRRQPWLAAGHPLEKIWLCEARDAMGLDTPALDFSALLAESERLGHVRQGLAALAATAG